MATQKSELRKSAGSKKPEGKKRKKAPKKRTTYKRRDMQAEKLH